MSQVLAWINEHAGALWAAPIGRAAALAAGAILAAGFLDRVLGPLLRRVVSRTRSPLDDVLLQQLRHPIALTVLLAGIGAALVALIPAGERVIDGTITTVLVLLWTIVSLRLTSSLLRYLSAHPSGVAALQPRAVPIFEIAIKSFIIGGCGYALLLAWGVDPTGWLASAGVVGIAVGFAAKDSLANVFAGLFLIGDASYRIGDFLQINEQIRGRVMEIGLRSTRIRTRDDIDIVVPNSMMANAQIVNESAASAGVRVRCAMTIAYGADLERVREVLVEVAREVQQVVLNVPDCAPRVRYRSFEENGVRLELLAWIREPADRGLVVDALIVGAYRRLKAEGISLAYPRRYVFLPRGAGRGRG